MNRQTNVSFADGTRQMTVYDAAGRRIAQVDQANVTTWFAYDGLGRLTSVTNALSKFTTYAYDEAGNQTNQVDALGHETRFEYDSLGRRSRRILPGGKPESFGYNLVGNLLYHTNFNGFVITNVYNCLNQLVARVYPDGTSNTFAYTATGQRQTMADASGTYSYVYDLRDNLRTNTTPAGTLTYSYDVNGNVTNVVPSTPGASAVAYSYDEQNRLTSLANPFYGSVTYRFDPVGNLQLVQYPYSNAGTYQYDSLNRLTNLTWSKSGSTFAKFSYQLGPAGNRTNVVEIIGNSSPATRTTSWQYDQLYRLTNESVTGSNPTGSLAYTYDDVGNRLSRSGSGLGPANQTFSYKTNDWLEGDFYDDQGNTTNSDTKPYVYDYEDRLVNFNNGQVRIWYNADGQRVRKDVSSGATTNTTLYLVDTRSPSGYPQVIEELSVIATTTNLAAEYVYGLSIISERAGMSLYLFVADGHGSTRMLVDGQTFNYDAYGNLIGSYDTLPTTRLYCGEEWDPDLGMYYLRARYLNPNTGRFWTRDGYEERPEDPLPLHRYVYAGNDPINNIDPSGNDFQVVGLLAAINISSGLFAAVSPKAPP
jgi:RHS repeat-associated protein